MDNINELINAAMEDWDQETNCGETDPAFQGEVGQEIDRLVDGLNQQQVTDLLKDTAPIIFVEGAKGLVEYQSMVNAGKVVYDKPTKTFKVYEGNGIYVFTLTHDVAAMFVEIFLSLYEQGFLNWWENGSFYSKGGPHE